MTEAALVAKIAELEAVIRAQRVRIGVLEATHGTALPLWPPRYPEGHPSPRTRPVSATDASTVPPGDFPYRL